MVKDRERRRVAASHSENVRPGIVREEICGNVAIERHHQGNKEKTSYSQSEASTYVGVVQGEGGCKPFHFNNVTLGAENLFRLLFHIKLKRFSGVRYSSWDGPQSNGHELPVTLG
jgi:hypothetical protein